MHQAMFLAPKVDKICNIAYFLSVNTVENRMLQVFFAENVNENLYIGVKFHAEFISNVFKGHKPRGVMWHWKIPRIF